MEDAVDHGNEEERRDRRMRGTRASPLALLGSELGPSWASGHKIPGTPTVYAGHPSIGFRELGDSDHLADALVLLRRSLAESRLKLKASTGAEKLIDASKKPGEH